MAGVGKMLKQAAKMQKKIESIQQELDERKIDITSGGGAVTLTITGGGVFQGLTLDPELLQEDKSLIEETILEAVKEAAAKAKAISDEEMAKATEGFSLPGLM